MSELSDVLRAYEPSGRIGARAVTVTTVWGTLSALLIGGLYLWARSRAGGFISIVLCDLVLLIVIAVAMPILFRGAESRSQRFNRWVAAIWTGVVLLPWWWVALGGRFASLESGTSLWQYVAHVLALLDMALECVVLGFIAIVCSQGVAKAPYSETAQRWASHDFILDKHWDGENSLVLVERIRMSGIGALLALKPASDAAIPELTTHWRSIRIVGCQVESDPTARWIQLAWIENRRGTDDDTDGKTERVDPLSFFANVQNSDYQALRAQASAVETISVTNDSSNEASVPETDLPTAVELEAAAAALESGEYTAALAIALDHCQHADIHVRSDANRVAALCLERLERWNEAFVRYQTLYEVERTPFNALQLACTSVMAGELERGKVWFNTADELNQAQPALRPVELRTGFLYALQQAGNFAECVPHLEWLVGIYRDFETTDSQLLLTHRVPPFEEFLAKSHTILKEVRSPLELRSWYRTQGDGLPNEWRLLLAEHIRRLI